VVLIVRCGGLIELFVLTKVGARYISRRLIEGPRHLPLSSDDPSQQEGTCDPREVVVLDMLKVVGRHTEDFEA
jgi:hypothetical protein